MITKIKNFLRKSRLFQHDIYITGKNHLQSVYGLRLKVKASQRVFQNNRVSTVV